jgi:hypothetical protein
MNPKLAMIDDEGELKLIGGHDQKKLLTIAISIDHLTTRWTVEMGTAHDVEVISTTATCGIISMRLFIGVLFVGLLAL